MDVTKPYEFIGFGAVDVPRPYEAIGFGAMDVTRPYELYRVWGVVHPQVHCAKFKILKLRTHFVRRGSGGRDRGVFLAFISQIRPPDPLWAQCLRNLSLYYYHSYIYLLAYLGGWNAITSAKSRSCTAFKF